MADQMYERHLCKKDRDRAHRVLTSQTEQDRMMNSPVKDWKSREHCSGLGEAEHTMWDYSRLFSSSEVSHKQKMTSLLRRSLVISVE